MPFQAVLLFLGIVIVVALASRYAPLLPVFLPPDLIAAALFLYAPLIHYRRGRRPSWLRIEHAGKSAVIMLALSAAGALAFLAYKSLPLPPSLAPFGGAAPPLAALVLREGLMAALPEEVFFRGYLYDAFEEKGWEPIVPTSVLFAVAHLMIFASWYRALTIFPGLLLGFSRKRTGNIYVPVLLHLFFNILPHTAAAIR